MVMVARDKVAIKILLVTHLKSDGRVHVSKLPIKSMNLFRTQCRCGLSAPLYHCGDILCLSKVFADFDTETVKTLFGKLVLNYDETSYFLKC